MRDTLRRRQTLPPPVGGAPPAGGAQAGPGRGRAATRGPDAGNNGEETGRETSVGNRRRGGRRHG